MNIKSPCIQKCELDNEGKFCLGCFRYLDEISDWEIFSDEKKKTILDSIKMRKL
tara:strand:- start:452 stop:613 length:162 start_codon:yes stop_codon:yes gene_type:complete